MHLAGTDPLQLNSHMVDKPIARARTTKRVLERQEIRLVRGCLHGGGGPQVGEVTRFGGVTRLSIKSLILM